ncbi:zinc finger 236 isoform X1, partial [Paramuricea clavata]
CHMEIIEPQNLQEHFVEDKSTGKYACNKCNRPFSNFMKLVKHVARQHGNDGIYQCGLCQELESKEPTGVGYVCCVCDVVFDVPRDLEDHMATHDLI